MWPSGTPSASSPRRRDDDRRGRRRGSSLITTIALTGILALLVMASLSFARSGTQQTARQGRADIAIQVADAGVNRYISRLVEDPRYYERWIDLAEDPRIDPTGVVHAPGTPWTPGVSWTYAGPPQTWVELQEARFGEAAYSLRVTPPPPGSDLVTVLSTGQSDRTSPRQMVFYDPGVGTHATNLLLHDDGKRQDRPMTSQPPLPGSSVTLPTPKRWSSAPPQASSMASHTLDGRAQPACGNSHAPSGAGRPSMALAAPLSSHCAKPGG